MPEGHAKPCQISKMVRNIESPDIEQFNEVFSGRFRDIQQYLTVQGY